MKGLGETEISFERRALYRHGQSVPIGERAFDILELLISRQGILVTKEQILDKVWPDSMVVENNLQVHISALRKALGNDRGLIRTVVRHGYLIVTDSTDDSQKCVTTQTQVSAIPSLATLSTQLPALFALIGREHLLEETRTALNSTSILTLTGPGGIGKTSLATNAARLYADVTGTPAIFVSLADRTHSNQIVSALAQALGIKNARDHDLEQIIFLQLKHMPVLLVLDNCEHVVESVALLAEQLVSSCPALKILATSREPLRIVGERGLRVPPLITPGLNANREGVLQNPSVQLFLCRARQQNSCCNGIYDAPLDDQSVELIEEICQRTEGVPLALEMAASRSIFLGLSELALDLRDDVSALKAGLRSPVLRHQSLQASFLWSYNLLAPDEQTLLRRIAPLEGRLTLEDVCNEASHDGFDHRRATNCVVELTQKSLLMMSAEGAFTSYRLLESSRACLLGQMDNASRGGYESRPRNATSDLMSRTPKQTDCFIAADTQEAPLEGTRPDSSGK